MFIRGMLSCFALLNANLIENTASRKHSIPRQTSHFHLRKHSFQRGKDERRKETTRDFRRAFRTVCTLSANPRGVERAGNANLIEKTRCFDAATEENIKKARCTSTNFTRFFEKTAFSKNENKTYK